MLPLALLLAFAPAGGGVSVSTGDGVNASGGSNAGSGGFEWPPFVFGGDALSLRAPLQLGLGSFVPRARLGLHWDHQLDRPHWLRFGAAGLFDRGDWQTIDLPDCGLTSTGGTTCQAGTIAGFDVSAEYVYKLYLRNTPFVVPTFSGGLSGGWWKYAHLTGTRAQSRRATTNLALRMGVGCRLFLKQWLGLGVDLDLALGVNVHRDELQMTGGQAVTRPAAFSASLAILPVVVELRV